MAEITVTKEEIDELATKLDGLGADLDEEERGLLLAVFALAGRAIDRAGDEVEGFTLGSGLPAGSRVQVSGVQPSTTALSDRLQIGLRAGPRRGRRKPPWDHCHPRRVTCGRTPFPEALVAMPADEQSRARWHVGHDRRAAYDEAGDT